MENTENNNQSDDDDYLDISGVDLLVDTSKVMGAATSGAMDGPRRVATIFWFALAILLLVGGVILVILGKWLLGFIGIISGIIVHSANKKSAAQFIIQRAEEDRAFRNAAILTGLIITKRRDQSHE